MRSTAKLHFQASIHESRLQDKQDYCAITVGQRGGWQRDSWRLRDFKSRNGLTVQCTARFPDVNCSPHSGQPPGMLLFGRENSHLAKCHPIFPSKFLEFSTGKNLPNRNLPFTPSLPPGHAFAYCGTNIYTVRLHAAEPTFTVVFQNHLETHFANAVVLLNHRL